MGLQTGMKKKDSKKMFKQYTPLEKKLLFPVLAIVWIVLKLYQCTHISNNKTKVTPKLEKQQQSQRRLMELLKDDTPKKPKNIAQLRRESSFLARSTVEDAEIAANMHSNKMTKRRETATRRLEERLGKRSGTYIKPKQSTITSNVKIKTYIKPSNEIADEEITIKVHAIRRKSERSRKKSIQLTLERGKKADLRVQERLALRKRAK